MNKLIVIILLFCFFPTYSQTINNEKNKAEQEIEKENFKNAIDIYQKIIKDSIIDYDVFVNLGYCYLQTGLYFDAINYLGKSVNFYKSKGQLGKRYSIRAMNYLAKAYFHVYDFENAKNIYEQIEKNSKGKSLKNSKAKIIQCDSAQKMFFNPKSFFVYRPGIINSDFPDYCPVMSVGLGKIFFTSRRPGSTGGKIDTDGLEYEDIYSVEINNGDYSVPKNIGVPINTDGYEATSSISFDGKTLFIYKSTDEDAGDIYTSNLENGKWTVPKRMDEPINKKSRETHASLSPDGKHIYFTSDRKGGQGGLDIYTADLSYDGKWINVRNLGKDLNTSADEEGPFISPDGKYLYFSSNGHIGMGGFDIYRCRKNADNTWSKPVNMGFPLNTVDDDLFYVPTNNPEKALYSSKQIDGVSAILFVQISDYDKNSILVKGSIFEPKVRFLDHKVLINDSVLFKNIKYPLECKNYISNDTFHIFYSENGIVMDSVCKIPKNNNIDVIDVFNSKIMGSYVSSKNGDYELTIENKGKYIVYYTSPGYSYNYCEIRGRKKNYNFNVELDSLIPGKIRIVKYSNFEKNSFELDEYQKIELKFLYNFLNENKNLCVDISAKGISDITEQLDNQRQNTIVKYLKENGLDSSRIFFNLTSDNVRNSVVQYTIYDTSLIKKVIDDNKKISKIVRNRVIHGVLVNDVRFELNMYKNPNFYSDLDFLAEFLIKNKESRIGVFGYTDIQGNSSYNIKLSQKRADFVKNYLLEKGVSENQVTAKGLGFSKQIAKNKNSKGDYLWNSMKYNRRVEIEILNQGKKEKLFVKPIDVPDQFQINISSQLFKYSINILSSEEKIPSSAFDLDVIELLGSDGLYNYITGEFEHEYEAENFVSSIRNKFPKAFVFINNYRN